MPAQLPAHWCTAGGPWWIKVAWQCYLHDLLLFRGRRRYALSISEHHPVLAGTDHHARLVRVNPVRLVYPAHAADRRRIRHCPAGREAFEQAVTVALVEHEAGHIRWSGAKPSEATLGWLWNALEDERQERLLARHYPELTPLFEFLGDAVWREQPVTYSLLAACLVWRWEHDHDPVDRAFVADSPATERFWKQAIRPLVEQAWAAPDSETVVAISREILHRLHLPEDQPLPEQLPRAMCRCEGGDGSEEEITADGDGHGGPGRGRHHDPGIPQTVPLAPPGARIPGRPATPAGGPGVGSGQGHDPNDPAQADPQAILAAIEGPASDLARWLRPPRPTVRQRPHPCRGELDLERALAGHDRPYDSPTAPPPHPTRAWMLLVDESSSMGSAAHPDSPIGGAIRTAMWLDRAAELARVTLGILGFDAGARPIQIRPLSVEATLLARRRIAGMSGRGGTLLTPSLRAAVKALQEVPAQRKVLIVIHDGQLDPHDALDTRQVCRQVPRRRIHVLPLYLGDDAAIIQANWQVFGHVLACSDLSQMVIKVGSWLRAVGA